MYCYREAHALHYMRSKKKKKKKNPEIPVPGVPAYVSLPFKKSDTVRIT
jgi:hypothetical protein